MEERTRKNAVLVEETSSVEPVPIVHSSSGEKKLRRAEKAQRILERKDPAYRAWHDEEMNEGARE